MSSQVIYDPECPYCVGISHIVDLSNRFETVSFESDKAQEVLEEEFEDPGFTFYLVEEEKIFFGDRAAQRIAEKLYRSRLAGKLFLELYPHLSKIFSVLSQRTDVRQPVCDEERCKINTEDGGIARRKG